MSTESLRARLAAKRADPLYETKADAILIAHAPTDLAAALDVIEAAKVVMRQWAPHGGQSGLPLGNLGKAIDRFEALS